MRIFHGIHNIGGMAGVLAEAQRQLGAQAVAHCLSTHTFRYKSDREFRATSRRQFAASMLRFAFREAWRYDVFQFYFGESLTGPLLKDVRWLKRLGKQVYFYFCGCDIRDAKATIAQYPVNACRECWPQLCSANRLLALETARRYADGVFVSTPDLLEFVPGSRLLPQPVDFDRFLQLRAETGAEPRGRSDRRVLIGHAPSNRAIKGTRYVEEAVCRLRSLGYPVELVLIENLSHREALARCAQLDLVVDQLLVGAYGQFSVEMMALGKPVVCYIRPDLQEMYPEGLPIVSADPDSLVDVLIELIGRPDARSERGRTGIDYALGVHDSRRIARIMLDTYTKRGMRCAS